MSAVLPPRGAIPFVAPRPAPRPAHAVAAGPAIRLSPPGGAARPPVRARRGTGLAVVVGLHVLVGWALASGLAKEAVQLVKKPIEMAIITEAPPPPPPPPPPKVERVQEAPKVEAPPPPAYVPPPEVVPVAPPPAPVIQAVQAEPPPKPVEIAPPPPPAPQPVAVKQEISLACPGYQAVLAQTLEEAIDRVGIEGTVRTLIKVRGNQVVDVSPQSGPKEYHKYLQSAVKRMRCSAGGADEVLVSLDVQFRR